MSSSIGAEAVRPANENIALVRSRMRVGCVHYAPVEREKTIVSERPVGNTPDSPVGRSSCTALPSFASTHTEQC